MKKVLFVLSAVAVVGFAEASARVYEFSASVKTTVTARGKLKNPCVVSNATDQIVYRKQGTIKLAGLIWGCGCTSLNGSLTYTDPSKDGCLFWDETNRSRIVNGTNTWYLLHRIDAKGTKAEGLMEIAGPEWYLLCGGFGTVKDPSDDAPVLWQLKGNFAGWRLAPTYTRVSYGIPCTFCESGTADVTESIPAEAWGLCDCSAPSAKTVIWGTWKLKYNANLSNKLNGTTSILNVYTFPSYVSSALK